MVTVKLVEFERWASGSPATLFVHSRSGTGEEIRHRVEAQRAAPRK